MKNFLLFAFILFPFLYSCNDPIFKRNSYSLHNTNEVNTLLTDTSFLAKSLDSLLLGLKNTHSETQQIDLLNVIAERLLPVDPERAVKLANVSVRFSKLFDYPSGEADSYIIKALYFTQAEVFDSAQHYFSFDSIYPKFEFELQFIRSLIGKGNLLRLKKKPAEAFDLFLECHKHVSEYSKSIDSLSNYRKWLECQKVTGLIYQNEGHAHLFKGDRLQALACYQKSLVYFSKDPDKYLTSIALNDIANCFEKLGNFQNAIDFFGLAHETASKYFNPHIESASLNSLGIIYENRGDFVRAYEYYNRSLALRKLIGDKKGTAAALNNLGNVLKKQGDVAKALDYHHQSIKIKEELNDQNGIAVSLNNIGIIFFEQKDFEKALDYYTRSLEIREKQDDRMGIAGSYNNLGIVYRNLRDLDKALEFYSKSLKIRMEIGDKRGISSVLNNIGIIHKTQGDVEKAIEYYQKSLAIQQELGQKSNISSTLSNIGHLYLQESNIKVAFSFGEKSYATAKEVGNPLQIKMAAKLLDEVYRKKGDHKNALKFYEEYIVMRDSVDNVQNRELTEKRYWQYEYQKKALADSLQHAQAIEVKNLMLEKKQEESKRQMVVIYALFFVFILVIVLAILIYRGYLMKIRTNKLISEKNLMLEQAFEEIKATSEALTMQNEMLREKNEKIAAQQEKLERTQKKLVQSEKMASIGVLTAGIAHEINNPINFVYAGANCIARDLMDIDSVLAAIEGVDENQQSLNEIVEKLVRLKNDHQFSEAYQSIRQTIVDIQNGAQRTAEIVQGLRSFASDDNEGFSKANVNRIMQDVLLLLKNRHASSVEIYTDFDSNIPPIECKPGKINQAFHNILTNAFEAIVGEGSVNISTRYTNESCIIFIRDSGVGIQEENIKKIFDPFYTTKKVGQGIGLGLSIAYSIIDEHGGSIEVESELGKGTAITIVLPVTTC